MLVLPAFNNLADKALSLSTFLNVSTLAALLVLIIFTSLLAGSYPAFFLTAFKPVTVLKGSDMKNSISGFFTRNVLVVFQFTVSTVLIVCTIVVYNNCCTTSQKDLGFNKENILVIANADRLGKSEESFRQELLRLPEVTNASITTSLPSQNFVHRQLCAGVNSR